MDLSNFSTMSLNYSGPHVPSNLWKILITLALSLLALATTSINSLVITAITVTRKLHQPANYLICSLAVTDLLVSVLVMPISIVYLVEETWVFGPAVCHLWLGIDVTCCTCSILHLAAIALDRYRAITNAVEYASKRTSRMALTTIASVWVISVFVSLPPLVWRKQGADWPKLMEQGGNGEVEDREMAEDDSCLIEHDHVAFTLYSTFGAFYVPLVLILILYYKIYRAAATLSHRRAAGRILCQHTASSHILPAEHSERELPLSPDTLSPTEKSFSENSVEGYHTQMTSSGTFYPLNARRRRTQPGVKERRAATTLGLILGAFVVCWLPFFLKEVVVNTCESCSASAGLANFLTWLGYLNSFINPLIYTIFNQDFKRAFQKLLRCNNY